VVRGAWRASTSTNPNTAEDFEFLREFQAQTRRPLRLIEDLLGDDDLRCVALRKLEWQGIIEFGDMIGMVPRFIVRRLRLMRRPWDEETGP
jgi:hypothetical protein